MIDSSRPEAAPTAHGTRHTAQDIIGQMIEAKAILAPMSGITDVPYRLLSRKFGCRFAFTEMIDINGVIYNNRKTFSLLERLPLDRPLGIQLVGQDEDKFLKVAKICEDKGFPVLDINAGCPARKVVSPGKGSALMKNPTKLAGIVRKLVKGLTIPVTVKIRSGWDADNQNYLEAAKVVESEGASAICIHPRTKEQMYKGKADHDITREIKEAVKIPVFASGNIFKAEDAVNILEQTDCDGVYVARGALGHPWIFNQINSALFEGTSAPDPDFDQIKKVMIEHFTLYSKFYEEKRLVTRMYKHIAWYLKGRKNLNEIMIEYRKCDNLEDFQKFVERLTLEERNRLEIT